MNYDEPIYVTYEIVGMDFTAGANEDLVATGPAGKQGRLISMSYILTTGVTVAASTIDVGDGTDVDAFGTMAVAIAATDSVGATFTDNTSDTNLIPADTKFAIGNGGGSTAGVGNAFVVIAWF